MLINVNDINLNYEVYGYGNLLYYCMAMAKLIIYLIN